MYASHRIEQGIIQRNFYEAENYHPCGSCGFCKINNPWECTNKVLAWREVFHNLVVNVGLDDLLDKYLKGSSYTAAFFVALKDTGTPVAADTMASHASWATISPYSNATDPALTLGTVASQSVDNSASKAVFNINATDTIFGAFVKDSNVVDVATGLLYGVGDFAASRAVLTGDTLNVQVTLTAAAA